MSNSKPLNYKLIETKNSMKKTALIIMSLLTIILMSCSKASKLESEAKKTMEQTFREVAKDANSLKFSNVKAVFSNDSLCIIRLGVSAKNGLGIETTSKMEYIYLVSGENKYESYQELGNDSIYLTNESYEKIKKGKIYEELAYDDALYYRAATFLNNQGRIVGDKDGEQDVKIPVPTGTGAWEIHNYIDEFGEEGSGKYLSIMGKGTFSNSATTGSRMAAILFVSKSGGMSFRLIEYNSSIVKSDDSYDCKIKDAAGDVITMVLRNNDESGNMFSWNEEENNNLHKALLKGGDITVSIRERYAYSTPDTYLFKMDVTGFEKAFSFL